MLIMMVYIMPVQDKLYHTPARRGKMAMYLTFLAEKLLAINSHRKEKSLFSLSVTSGRMTIF